MTSPNPNLASAALRNAVPYLRLFQGRTFVVKVGGEAFQRADEGRDLLEQVSVLHRLGIHVVLVHGGGPQITQTAERLGVETQFVGGRRVTSPETLEATTMALNGRVNPRIVAAFRELDTPAVGLSGIDGGLIRATRRPLQDLPDGGTVDYGQVGDIEGVDPLLLGELIGSGFLPVVSPLCADSAGSILNVNADVAAARISMALGAAKLIFLTGAPGILRDAEDASSLISWTDIDGLVKLQEEGSLGQGMLPKATSIVEALRGGVERVHVISHRQPDALLLEVFTNEGSGTLIVREETRLAPEEAQA